MSPLRLNLGSGEYPLDGFVNIDQFTEADIQGDFITMEWSAVDEVVMSHVLEHLPWRFTIAVLGRVHSWMKLGAKITVEVPDMEELFKRGTEDPMWVLNIFGAQVHPGEFHQAGFTPGMLASGLEAASFTVVSERRFLSDVPLRVGYPCLEMVATA